MDNLNQIATLIEQYKQNGGDMNAITKLAQSLAIPNKTPLGLTQWVSSDKPTMGEFNENNRIIDEKILEIDGQLGDKVDKSYVDSQLANKANITSQLNMLFVPLLNGYLGNIIYMKDGNGWVSLIFSINRDSSPIANELIGILPVGYRPNTQLYLSINSADGSWLSSCIIFANGNIQFPSVVPSTSWNQHYYQGATGGISFRAFP